MTPSMMRYPHGLNRGRKADKRTKTRGQTETTASHQYQRTTRKPVPREVPSPICDRYPTCNQKPKPSPYTKKRPREDYIIPVVSLDQRTALVHLSAADSMVVAHTFSRPRPPAHDLEHPVYQDYHHHHL